MSWSLWKKKEGHFLCRLFCPKRNFLRFVFYLNVHLFFIINNPFLTLAPKIVQAFLKNCPKKLFSNCLVDGILTSVVSIFEHSECYHSLLQGHLQYVKHTFELTSQKVSISLRFPMQKKVFSLLLQWIV